MEKDAHIELLLKKHTFTGHALTTAFISFGIALGESMREDPTVTRDSILRQSEGASDKIIKTLELAEIECQRNLTVFELLQELRTKFLKDEKL